MTMVTKATAVALALAMAAACGPTGVQSQRALGGLGVTGGWSTVDVKSANEKTLLDALTTSESNYAATLSTRVCVTRVVSMEQQVVSGMNYRFHVLACDVGSIDRAGWCANDDADCKPQPYVVQVYEQSWTNTLQVMTITKDTEVDNDAQKENREGEATASDSESTGTISSAEKKKILNWLEAEDRNQYGDKKGTMYTGGTPLFDENTGTSMDRFEYIAKQHPDRPWLLATSSGDDDQGTVLTVSKVRAVEFKLAAQPANVDVDHAAQSPSANGTLLKVVATLGVFSAFVGVVAFAKLRGNRRRFTYDSINNRET